MRAFITAATAACLYVTADAEGFRVRPPTTTTPAPGHEKEYCHFPADARWRVRAKDAVPDDCVKLFAEKRDAVDCAKTLSGGYVQYVRTMEFDFCQAYSWYAVPISPEVGDNETFWHGVTEAWMTLPIVNTGKIFNPTALQLYGTSDSQGGTSCQIDANDQMRALAGGLIDAEVTEIDDTHVTVDLMKFLDDSYIGLDHKTLLVTADKATKTLPPKTVGDFKGLLAVVRSEECTSSKSRALLTILPLVYVILLLL